MFLVLSFVPSVHPNDRSIDRSGETILFPYYKFTESSIEDALGFMCPVTVKNETTIGVALQQDDLPMIQIYRNGEPVQALNKFRGAVYPAVYIPETASTAAATKVRLVFEEENFQELPPSVRFGPVIVARGII